MKYRELIVPLYLKNGAMLKSPLETTVFCEDVGEFAASCENMGADALLLFDLSEGDKEHDETIGLIKQIGRATDLPMYGGGNIRRLEDVKKLIYAGCRKVFLNYAKQSNRDLTIEASARFGQERMLACVKTTDELQAAMEQAELLDGVMLLDSLLLHACVGKDMLSAGTGAQDISQKADCSKDVSPADHWETICCKLDTFETKAAAELLTDGCATGIFSMDFVKKDFPFMEEKHSLLAEGIAVNTYEASLRWEEVRTNSDGLLPVVVQDYRTMEVLMMAYMNEEAYETTIRTGRMTYWSRSRKELWVKGLTSGHFQYVRELAIDCDNDTLLAKVVQIGAACHTGNRSCFYRTVLKKEYDSSNPLRVFEEVFAVIEDRKVHPKEGSYTNYLFDKGIDKILKKVGEEATEIIIAAKNPDPEEVIYEISDFLYHVMVLMSERGLTWEDITEELAKR